ncbi:hypothetical protein LTV02_09395 [Nocardia yamanashiensis]|uniref:hypothetical protein n=1 Tax=Nocardia yamanashiensis TaxID=209247 RepID=UPI001E558E98|nr:hypothetical protein [Nocardia yamanashiensis]UGT43571.1 hypothetical protein LTV02_09395 [Nocardia yamanashiensis]
MMLTPPYDTAAGHTGDQAASSGAAGTATATAERHSGRRPSWRSRNCFAAESAESRRT